MEFAPAMNDVSETAIWVAWYRAEENKRKDAHFRDIYAEKFIGDKGLKIVKSIKSESMRWVFVARTLSIDNNLLDCLKESKIDAVLNLGAGFDVRPFRLNLPQNLTWIDVDLANIIEIKKSVLADVKPNCAVEYHVLNLEQHAQRSEFLKKIAGRFKNIFVISEGLTPYLNEMEVGTLAKNLSQFPSYQHWTFDYMTIQVLHDMEVKWGKALHNSGCPFKFGIPDACWFESYGWSHINTKFTVAESLKQNRLPPYYRIPFALISKFSTQGREKINLRGGGVALMKNTNS